jgi:biotin operon repressor
MELSNIAAPLAITSCSDLTYRGDEAVTVSDHLRVEETSIVFGGENTTATQLKSEGIDLEELRNAGYRLESIDRGNKKSVGELWGAGYSIRELKEAGYAIHEIDYELFAKVDTDHSAGVLQSVDALGQTLLFKVISDSFRLFVLQYTTLLCILHFGKKSRLSQHNI